MMRAFALAAGFLGSLFFAWSCSAFAQELAAESHNGAAALSVPSQGRTALVGRGPSDVTQVLKKQERASAQLEQGPSPIQQWYGFKKRLKDTHNFDFVLAYTAVHQRVSEDIVGGAQGIALLLDLYDYLDLSPPPGTPTKEAAGGIAEFTGAWTVFGANSPNKGSFGFSVESRHKLGTVIPPQNLFLDAGAYWPTATAFNEFDLSVLELYYEQYFAGGAAGFRVGKMNAFPIYDYMSLKNPKTDFLNAAFNLNPAIGWPSFAFGVAGIVRPVKQLYVIAGIHDINGGPTRGIQTFFEDEEYFKAVEVGWDTELEFGNGNIHALFWDTDRRTSTNTPGSRGVTIGGEQAYGRLLPFFRYGYSEGGGTPLRHLVAGGIGLKSVFGRPNDAIGVGLSWGEPINNQLFVDQKAAEIYYRIHITEQIAFTPSLQYVKDPPLNLAENDLYLFSVRGRAAF
jgi:porin